MAGRIPQHFIDDLLARADIVSVIDERVPLKKAGREYEACCPFHGEKTPSFKVSPNKQFYHCFGCGAHGTVLGFIMDYERLEFLEAIDMLAERCGVTIPDSGDVSADQPDTRPLYAILEEAAAFYRRQLKEHPEASEAIDYLKGRGLTGLIAKDFGLGYAPPGWDNLVKALGTDEHRRELLKAAGLANERSGGGLYDRFRERVMFPILDRRGRHIGFGARVLGAEEGPKYLNSPESAVFHKGRELYGRSQLGGARPTGARVDHVLVVEGYMDVVALAQHGIRNAVATLGTAATPEHLESLFRIAPDVVFCFDGDNAGRRAAWRALENGLPQMRDGRRARFMFLPDGEDPDSLVRSEGASAFRQRVQQASNLSDFLFERLCEELDLDSIEGRSRLQELGQPMLERLPDGAFRALAFSRLAELTGIASKESSKLSRRAAQNVPARTSVGTRKAGSLVRRAIVLLLNQPSIAIGVAGTEALAALDRPGVPLLVELIELLRSHPHLTPDAIIERYREHALGRHLASLLAQPLHLEDGLEQEFHDCIDSILSENDRERDTSRLRDLTAKGLDALTTAERQELTELVRTSRG